MLTTQCKFLLRHWNSAPSLAAFTGLAKQSYRAGGDIEEERKKEGKKAKEEREEGKRNKRGKRKGN